ncbi:Negative cofactor 2 complex subunit beta [Smittium culicis]|uniref:Negative cofactor 2 complex subunit beta n=1 Tax=Smittium culicis TaxID=133412 RepID=A0A1R1WZF8_9FUNG|nr:Negative cofactor 2 complex subunit beta [Smittium culicis]
MSDYEGNGAGEDDLSLPRATVYKLIGEMLPDDISCAKETRDLLIDCCNGKFISTLIPLHRGLFRIFVDLGFGSYITEVKEAYSEHRQQQNRDRGKKSAKLDQLGMTQEELLKSQEALFAQARLKFENKNKQPSEESENK